MHGNAWFKPDAMKALKFSANGMLEGDKLHTYKLYQGSPTMNSKATRCISMFCKTIHVSQICVDIFIIDKEGRDGRL